MRYRSLARRTGLLALAALAVASFEACAGSGGGLPITHYYTLGAPGEAESAHSAGSDEHTSGAIVGVYPFAVDPPYDQDRLVYRKGKDGSEVGFYAYHRWASPLGSLVAVALADGLSEVEGVASIEPARSGGDYTATLDGRLLYLEEVDSPDAQEVRMALELVMRDTEGALLLKVTASGVAGGQAREVPEVMALVQQVFDVIVQQAAVELEAALEAL